MYLFTMMYMSQAQSHKKFSAKVMFQKKIQEERNMKINENLSTTEIQCFLRENKENKNINKKKTTK